MSNKNNTDLQIRQEIIWAARTMLQKGYVIGTAGNISTKNTETNTIIITPSGAPYDIMKPEELVECDLNGKAFDASRKPSSEILLHTYIYKNRPEIHSIVHTHSVYATSLAVNGTEIPYCLDEMIYSLGPRPIPVAKHAPGGTEELANNVVNALGKENKAALMKNHGTIALGNDMHEAFEISELIEKTAMIYIFSKLTGKVNILKK